MGLRVRFAPSPTGYLHVGGARTALFNWLLARRLGGVFVLRIEDTDAERSSDEMVEGILDGLRWLGLDWDEGPKIGGEHGPYFQSQRFDRHRAMAGALVASGHAYYCYCTPEELRARREAAEKVEGGWKYDRVCLALTADEIARRERAKMPRAVRFKVPAGTTTFDDLVHGTIEFDHANIEDFVILRSDGLPTYMLSVVSDDVEMKITHVVRGDDHISNTPKQILLYRAIDAELPAFAHVPLILGPDKKRLSKRHGATSVTEYERQGFLPEAMVNFLALLGWSPGDDRELFAKDDLTKAFALEGISGGNAVFNLEKLEWFNQQYLMRLAPDDLALRVKPSFEAAGLWDDGFLPAERSALPAGRIASLSLGAEARSAKAAGEREDRHAWFFAVLELFRPRAKRLSDFAEQGRFFFNDQIDYDSAAVEKHLRAAGMDEHLAALGTAFAALATFDTASIEGALRAVAEARGVKAATLIHAVRVAVTGKTVSPGLFEVLALLGRDRVSARMAEARRLVSTPAS